MSYASISHPSKTAPQVTNPAVSRAVRLLPWLAMTLLALFLAVISLRYFSFRPDINFLRVKQAIVHDILWRTAFYLHISAGVAAIAIGPFQFLWILRKKDPKLHRSLGKVYIAAILFLGAPFGFYMALFANGGPWASTGFAVMAMLWFYTTSMAYQMARSHNFTEHRRWMFRSYALTFSAVTLRLWVPFCSIFVHLDPELVIQLSAWVSWGINLAIAELLLLLDRKYKMRIAH